MRNPPATVIAIVAGLMTILLAYLLPSALPGTEQFRTLILGWAVNLAAVATIVAILSLLYVHLRKAQAKRNPDYYSFLTLICFVVTFLAGCLAYLHDKFPLISLQVYQQIVVNGIQVPVEASLMAVLAVSLLVASFRLFQRRRGIIAVAFLISTLVFLLFNSGIVSLVESMLPPDSLSSLAGFIQVLPVAGGRGILIGIALGSIMAGLRILFGAERPYTG